jgi:dUTP pyrophosphatase
MGHLPEQQSSVDTRIKIFYTGKFEHPFYATSGSAGFDFTANIEKEVTIPVLGTVLIPTGVRVSMPYSRELQIRSKSGLSLKYGLIVKNAPATIDADYEYTGLNISVILWNTGDLPYTVKPGEKIAQGVFAPVYHASECFTKKTEKTRTGGYGSTGR